MYRIALLIALLSALSPSSSAQAGDPGADQVRGPGSNATSLQGCLQREGFQYSLIDDAGKSHLLIGNTRKLSHYVGHRVGLTGKSTIKTIDTTETLAASTVEEIPAFQVATAKQISNTCTSPH